MKLLLFAALLCVSAFSADLDMSGYSILDVSNIVLRAKYTKGRWPKIIFLETNVNYNMNASIGLYTNVYGEDGLVANIGTDQRLYIDENTIVLGNTVQGMQMDRTAGLINFLGSWNINACTNRIINVAWPTATNDAASKCYVDVATNACLHNNSAWMSGTLTVSNSIVVYNNVTPSDDCVLNGDSIVFNTPGGGFLLQWDAVDSEVQLMDDSGAIYQNLDIADPSKSYHAATMAYVDNATNKVDKAGINATNALMLVIVKLTNWYSLNADLSPNAGQAPSQLWISNGISYYWSGTKWLGP